MLDSTRKAGDSPDDATVSDPELGEVLRGLRSTPPRVSPRWFYDALGSALFEAITRVDAYYPTRCEIELLELHAAAIGRSLPPGLAVVELGSGSAEKVGRMLPLLREPRAYHPIDVSQAALDATAREIEAVAPGLWIESLHGDFTRPDQVRPLLERVASEGPVLLFFPGSTIGNFDDAQASRLLAGLGEAVPAGTPFLLGADLIKPRALLEAAYDDPAGVTAAFNRNMLSHLNRRFGADFDPRRWRHEARWVPERHRVEMWLRSRGRQCVHVGPASLEFADGDGIHTESSHKWDRARIEALAASSGWRVEDCWTDSRSWFAEVLLRRAPLTR